MTVYELTRYRAAPGTSEPDVIAAVTGARVWMVAQPGFRTHALLHDANGYWTDLVEWADMATAEAAKAAFDPAHPALVPLMGIVDMESLSMGFARKVA